MGKNKLIEQPSSVTSKSKEVINNWFSTCARCGKEFYKAPEHMYKIKKRNFVKFYCSYTCFLRAKEELENK